MKRDISILLRDHLSDKGLNVPSLVAVLVLEKVVCCAMAGHKLVKRKFCPVIYEPDDEKKEG